MLTVLGENIIDLVPTDVAGATVPAYLAHAGGSPANTAVAAAKLGSAAALIARISRDTFGTQIRDRLVNDGVSDRYLVTASEPSSLAVVSFDAERRASYDFWLTGTADWQWGDNELPEPLDDDVESLHIGSIAAFLEPGASTIGRMVRAEADRGKVTLSFDPNIRPGIVAGPDGSLDEARARVEALLGVVDVVKASDEDLAWLYPAIQAETAAKVWASHGPALVVVTRGPDGAVAIGRTATVAVPAPVVDVVDTVGAGDAFSGALLHAMSQRGLLGAGGGERIAALDADGLTYLITVAVTASAVTCTRQGAVPPTAQELAAALNQAQTIWPSTKVSANRTSAPGRP